ncbi:hypothetical protein [Moorena sp. SIO1F2]|uniref:hypothetical protein n=1 Tax=Moorena sp. SIO1F2 TaxID=2607819 RepID=UPI0025FA892F|nr:hypothetical protein [Moorena sp. SIO1F2]
MLKLSTKQPWPIGHAIARLRDEVHRVQPDNQTTFNQTTFNQTTLAYWPRDRSTAGRSPSRSTKQPNNQTTKQP